MNRQSCSDDIIIFMNRQSCSDDIIIFMNRQSCSTFETDGFIVTFMKSSTSLKMVVPSVPWFSGKHCQTSAVNTVSGKHCQNCHL